MWITKWLLFLFLYLLEGKQSSSVGDLITLKLFIFLVALFMFIWLFLYAFITQLCQSVFAQHLQPKARKWKKSEEIGGFTISKIKLHVIQAFHKKESKFSSFPCPLTRNNQVWIMNEEPNERSKAWMSAGIQPIGSSSNRSVGQMCNIPAERYFIQPISWTFRSHPTDRCLPTTDRLDCSYKN